MNKEMKRNKKTLKLIGMKEMSKGMKWMKGND